MPTSKADIVVEEKLEPSTFFWINFLVKIKNQVITEEQEPLVSVFVAFRRRLCCKEK